MIYFLYGADDFRIKQRLASLRAGLLAADVNLDVQIRDAGNLSAADLSSLLMTQSLLSVSRLIIINQPIANGSDDFHEGLIKLLGSSLPEGVVLILTESQPDQRTKLFKLLNKSIAEAYPLLKAPEARRWLQDQARAQNIKLDDAVVGTLVENFSDDLWRMSSELNKLATFTGGQPITKAAVDRLTPKSLTDNIFTAIEALSRKNLALSNQLINRQLLLGMPEQQLIAMIAYQFRNIVLIRAWLDQGVKPADLAAKTGLHPYVVQKTTELSRRFSITELDRVFYLLQKVDAAIKRGVTPPRVGLDILTAQIVSA